MPTLSEVNDSHRAIPSGRWTSSELSFREPGFGPTLHRIKGSKGMAALSRYTRPAQSHRFGVFEAGTAASELRRLGMRISPNALPFHVLLMLLGHPGLLLTRDEVSRVLWPEGTVADYMHYAESAVDRIREALLLQRISRRPNRKLQRFSRHVLYKWSDHPSQPLRRSPAQRDGFDLDIQSPVPLFVTSIVMQPP